MIGLDCDYSMGLSQRQPSVFTHAKRYGSGIVHSNDNVTEGTMPNEEKMSINERRKYLRLIKKRYLKASKFERGRLLDEMEAITGLHRKSLIRLMSGSLQRKPRHKRRGRTYGPEVDDALRVISGEL